MKNMVVVGSHLGYQVPYTSNNHEILFIQPVGLDLVGIDTSTLIKVVKVLCTPVCGQGGPYGP